ncbi:MAG: hypothetical protein UU09_C0018G0004 [Microgenomates group bacterium GW2011_GWA2_40_6]|nr:MAG: hypothetical protein UU09_C0018G0004 [Microgenomates group bacterium GW2011_GWA2_40_6]
MSKIKIAFFVAVTLILSGCTQKTVIPTVTSIPTTPVPKLLTWSDPSGFTFEYPEGITINNHPEDTKNYANLTLSSASSEIMQITMTDNTFKSLDAWVGKSSAIDTTLGDKAAKKIIINNQTTLACIDGDVLVTITGNDISQVADSWIFVYPTPTIGVTKKVVAPAVSDDSGDVLEEY